MKNKKILIPCLIAITLASIIAIICIIINGGKNNKEYQIDGINLVENKEILKDVTVSNLEITDVSLLTRDGISTFKAIVSNNTHEEITINGLYVKFHLKEEEKKVLVLGAVKLSPNDKTYINVTSETDLSSSTKIEYILENQ